MRTQHENMGQFAFLSTFGPMLVIFGHFWPFPPPKISNISKIFTRNKQNGTSICVTQVSKPNQCQSNPERAPNNGFYIIFLENFT